MSETKENLRRRLYYQATHRGVKEADLLLGAFARIYLPMFGDSQLGEFDRLLQLHDHIILNWRFGHTQLAPEYDNLITRLLLAFDLTTAVAMDSINLSEA